MCFQKINNQCAIFVVFFRKPRKVENRKQKQKDYDVAKLFKIWLKPSIYLNYQQVF